LDNLETLFEQHGRAAIAIVREHDPSAYVRLIARLVHSLP